LRIFTKRAKNKMVKKTEKKKDSKFGEKLHWISGHIMAVISIILVVVAFGGAYYFVIAPNMVLKPFIEKPSLPENGLSRIQSGEQIISSEHINYLINEIGAYKLRKKFGTKDYPVMEFFLTDINVRYYSYVKDNLPVTKKGNAKNEDIIIKGSQEVVFNIFESMDISFAVKEAKDNGDIQFEIVSDTKTLAIKGYFPIYDNLK